MEFLRNVEFDELTRKELCRFVSRLSSSALVAYKNTEYQFKEYTESDSVMVTQLNFTESRLYSVPGAKNTLIFISVVAHRCVYLKSLRYEDDEDAENLNLDYFETEELRQHKAENLAAEEARKLDDYYYIACVSHDELLDKDNLICVDDVIIDTELYAQLKAIVFASSYEAALSVAKEKYSIVRALESESGDVMVPALEYYEGENNESN